MSRAQRRLAHDAKVNYSKAVKALRVEIFGAAPVIRLVTDPRWLHPSGQEFKQAVSKRRRPGKYERTHPASLVSQPKGFVLSAESREVLTNYRRYQKHSSALIAAEKEEKEMLERIERAHKIFEQRLAEIPKHPVA